MQKLKHSWLLESLEYGEQTSQKKLTHLVQASVMTHSAKCSSLKLGCLSQFQMIDVTHSALPARFHLNLKKTHNDKQATHQKCRS